MVPLLEKLYRLKWDKADGLGAIIISPTRELALQIFDVMRQIGRYHSFSAGLVIGGKDFNEVKKSFFLFPFLNMISLHKSKDKKNKLIKYFFKSFN